MSAPVHATINRAKTLLTNLALIVVEPYEPGTGIEIMLMPVQLR